MDDTLLKRICDNFALFTEQEILDTAVLFSEPHREVFQRKWPKEYEFSLQTLELMKQRLEKHNL